MTAPASPDLLERSGDFWRARPLNRAVLILITVFMGASMVSDMVLGDWTQGDRAPNVLLTLLTGIPFFLLWIRSTVAFTALIPGLIASHVFGLHVSPSLLLPVILVLVAASANLPFSLFALAVSISWAASIPITTPEDSSSLWVVVPLLAGGWTIGHFIQQSLARRERDLRRVAEATRRAAEAAQEERRLLARDLHDIVAHNLTIIAMQTRTAQFVGTDEAARMAVQVAGDSAKEALGDLRRMLTLLQAEGLVADPANASETDAQDGASALDLEHGAVKFGRGLESLGISTAVRTEGLSEGISQSVQTALYRVMQEAVTNVAKHAGGGSEAVIELDADDQEVRLAVGNSLGMTPRGRGAWMSSGHGLVGMRDRVTAFGGTFTSGREKDWWWVRAGVPIPSNGHSSPRM